MWTKYECIWREEEKFAHTANTHVSELMFIKNEFIYKCWLVGGRSVGEVMTDSSWSVVFSILKISFLGCLEVS